VAGVLWRSSAQIHPHWRANLGGSIPVTWATVYTGDMANTLASKGIGAHPTRQAQRRNGCTIGEGDTKP
jgi:hypothetical protein